MQEPGLDALVLGLISILIVLVYLFNSFSANLIQGSTGANGDMQGLLEYRCDTLAVKKVFN